MLRRTLWRWLAVAMLAATATAALPTSASAAELVAPRCVAPAGDAVLYRCLPAQPATAGLKHVGWTYLNLNYCPPGAFCAAVYRGSMGAWSWTATGWKQTSLAQGWVYVYPYTGEWRWAWTQSTGWVAVSGGRFELRAY